MLEDEVRERLWEDPGLFYEKDHLLIKNAVEKYVVRAVAARFLPHELVNREKFGFVAPGSRYLLSNQGSGHHPPGQAISRERPELRGK